MPGFTQLYRFTVSVVTLFKNLVLRLGAITNTIFALNNVNNLNPKSNKRSRRASYSPQLSIGRSQNKHRRMRIFNTSEFQN